MHTAKLKPREHHRILEGHLWVFRNELSVTPDAAAGEVVHVLSFDERPLGIGFYHPTSRIAIRMAGGVGETVDVEYFERRFRRAQELRNTLLPAEEAYRVVFGEADFLSGLIVDRFADTLVVQMFSAGMDVRRHEICEALRRVLPTTTGIVERNSMPTRVKEGLELRDGLLWGTVPDRIPFRENGLRLEVDVVGGQKTGYFLDQKLNRSWVGARAAGMRVLDAFCNVGGFALCAAKGGATKVLGVDSSAHAIEHAKHHAHINELQNVEFQTGNVFDVLRDHASEGRTWDMIILDPPSFAKTRSALPGARSGYSELNRAALKLLEPGGLLVSASCTQLIPEHELLDIVYREAARLRKPLRLVHRGNQAPDHPVLLAMPETAYLKFLVFDVA